MKRFLLPHFCKQIGLGMLVVMLIATASYIFIEANTETQLRWMIGSANIALYLSIVLITLSREKDEDEMTAELRGQTLKEVGYCLLILYSAYRIVGVLISEGGYILHDEEFITPFIAWVAYYARFEHKLKQLRRENRQFKL